MTQVPRDDEDDYEALARDGAEYRLEQLRHVGERRRVARRSEDDEPGGWTIRPSDLQMWGGLLAIVLPLFGVAFYVRDVAQQVTFVVMQQAVAEKMVADHESRLKALEALGIRFDGGAQQRTERLNDHELRIRTLEGKP